jgi:hypothetical protein
MTGAFPALHLALSLAIVIWDVILAGRIAQLRHASRPFAAITGICGLMLLPALLLRMATATYLTSRAVVAVDWIWPVIVIFFAVQAVYALARRLVNPLWGIPIVVYDLFLAVIEIVRFGVAHGSGAANAAAAVLMMQSTSLAVLTGSSIAVTTPFFFFVPMISPAFPALRRATAAFRGLVATCALVWVVFFLAFGVRGAASATKALAQRTDDRLRERPKGDFRVGLKVFPELGPKLTASTKLTPGAMKNDLDLITRSGVRAIEVVIDPGADKTWLDSLARAISQVDDSMTVIAAIGYTGKIIPELRSAPFDESARYATIQKVMAEIKPDILLPAEDPMAVGARVAGSMSVDRWKAYYTEAARQAKAIDPHVRIGYSVSSFGIADSIMYDWAARKGSPVDIVGFSFFPEKLGIRDIVEAFEPAADRWMKTLPPQKDHWVFATGGFPLNTGERTQDRIIWNVLSWATDHPAIKGAIVYEGSDYAQARGLRAPNGRLRRAFEAIVNAVRQLRESATG